jgi:hypothetical protein
VTVTRRITTRERHAILASLGAGVVPALGLHHIQVGRKDEVGALVEDLKRIEAGGSTVRFVVGRYGSGKSFFLNLIRTVALERRFVCLHADITTHRRFHGTKGQAQSLYSELTRNAATRSKPEGGALPNLVGKWVADVRQEVLAGGGADADVQEALVDRCRPLQDLVAGYDFAAVLGQYFRGHLEDDEGRQSAALRWLRAEYGTKTEARQDLGVRSIIDDADFYDYLKLMARFARIAGYSGLLVCFDELIVLSHRLNNRTSRNHNYEAVLRMLNDCLQGSVEGMGLVFAATNDCMYDRRRGLFSYEALETRLARSRFSGGDLVDLAGPVIELQPLTPEDCYVLLHNIRHVHAKGKAEAYAVPDEAIVAYLSSCKQRMGAAYFQTPRETIKDFVGLLNVLQQNPLADWRELVGAISTTDVQTRDPVEAEADAAAAERPDDDLATFKL